MSDLRKEQHEGHFPLDGEVPGIVIADGRLGGFLGDATPRIAAFIWGGKVRPAPTLPFGRWKGAA